MPFLPISRRRSSQNDPMRHVRSLKGITNLFVTSAESLAEAHVEVYDAVMRAS